MSEMLVVLKWSGVEFQQQAYWVKDWNANRIQRILWSNHIGIVCCTGGYNALRRIIECAE